MTTQQIIESIPQTADTYNTRAIPDLVGQAMDRSGYEGFEWEKEPESVKIARKQHWAVLNGLWDLGKVGVSVTPDSVHLTYRTSTRDLRGAAVEGSDYLDEFVRSRARELRDMHDGRVAAKMS